MRWYDVFATYYTARSHSLYLCVVDLSVTVWHRSEINTTQFGGSVRIFFSSLARSKGQTESIAIDTHQNGKCELVLGRANGKYVQTLFLECWECEWKRWQKGAHSDWAGWLVCRFVCLLADGAFNGRVVSQSHILCGSDQCITSSGVLLDFLFQVWLADKLPTRL